MHKEPYEPSVSEALCAQAIGREMLKFARSYQEHTLARQVNTDAVLLLGEIQKVLDDTTLSDPECFLRIDAIVQLFQDRGLSTTRHDF